MRRAHRTLHLGLWILLIPALALIAWLALSHDPGSTENESLPASLIEEG